MTKPETVKNLQEIKQLVEKQSIPLLKDRVWYNKVKGEYINMNTLSDVHIFKNLSKTLKVMNLVEDDIIELMEKEEKQIKLVQELNEQVKKANKELQYLQNSLKHKESKYTSIEHTVTNLCDEMKDRNIQEKYRFNPEISKGTIMDIKKKLSLS